MIHYQKELGLDALYQNRLPLLENEKVMYLHEATNEELVEELIKRTTFRGLVVWQVNSFKGFLETGWRWRSKNCDEKEVAKQLSDILNDTS